MRGISMTHLLGAVLWCLGRGMLSLWMGSLNKFIQIGWVPPHLSHRLFLQALEMEASLCGPGWPLPPGAVSTAWALLFEAIAESWKGPRRVSCPIWHRICAYHGSKICAIHCQLARLEGERGLTPWGSPTLLHSKLCHWDMHLIFSAVHCVQGALPQSAVQAVEG